MARIDELLAAMTLTEKLGQLTMTACSSTVTGPIIAGDSTEALKRGEVGNLLNLVGLKDVHALQRLAVEESRLKIPLLIGLDVVHGHRTLFPIPLAEACSFDRELWRASSAAAAREAAADGIVMTFAPMLDVARDPRWGRSAEGPGEDPFVGREMASAKVRGFQGEDLKGEGLAACAKHYCAYSPVTAGREYASVDVSDRTVLEVYVPPFAAAVKAGVVAIMPAFTDLAGIPMTAHAALLRGLLREKLGFDGIIVSDYNAVGELIRHGVAADKAEAAALALKAGVDIDMMADAYRQGLPVALERGLVQMADIDAAVLRVLKVKDRLGLFENPYRHAPQDDAGMLRERRALSRRTAAASMVLLKNEQALPLKGGYQRLALLGPLSIASAEMRGPWWGAADPAGHISVYEGLRALWPTTEILCESGCGIEGDDISGIKPALAAVDLAEVVILCLGESAVMSGEAASRAHIELPGIQQQLADAVCARAAAQHKRVVAVVFSGRPLAIAALAGRVDALIAAWFPGSEAGHALADILSGSVSPSAKTAVSWPRTLGQVPVFFAQRPGGRPAAPNDHYTSKYLDVPNEPLFAFGAGLTYGEFAYSALSVSPARLKEADSIEVSATLRNVGARTATETVFVFTRDPVASVSRPLLELRGFTRVTLEPGRQQRVSMRIPAAELRFLGVELKPVYEPGELEVLLGPSAERSRLLSAKIQQI